MKINLKWNPSSVTFSNYMRHALSAMIFFFKMQNMTVCDTSNEMYSCSWHCSCLTSRQFCMELNGLAVRLQSECHPETCTQMTATEQWIFLCAAHKTPKECPAIDYTRHTLDGAACLLNSNKYFPSRLELTCRVFL